MKRANVFLLLLMVVLIACQTKTQNNESIASGQEKEVQKIPYFDLSVSEFKTKMTDPNTVVLDVRTSEEVAEGNIEGAVVLDFYDASFSEKIAELDKGKTYLVYCRSGNRSGKTCKMMAEQGFEKLYNLDGGFTAWSSAQ